MGLNQEKKISFHRILIPLCLTRVCVSIFKPQVGFFDVRKCFTDYCTALSIVTTCQKKRWSKNTRHTFLRANLSRPYCPSRVSHTKKIFWGSSCLHSSRYCHQKFHINVLAQWVYISDISYHQIHMLYHYMKKKYNSESQSSHQNIFFSTMFLPFIRQINSGNEKILEL